MTPVVGRFAPSPTGPLHFGSLVAAVGSYCLARQAGGRWLLRIEDLDLPRVVAGAADNIMRALEQLGLLWDGPVVWQSQRNDVYQEALDRLQRQGLLFDCGCSRREILASAPHAGEEGPVYPGTCRNGLLPERRPRMQRVRVPSEQVCFTDGVYGARAQCLSEVVGDFVLRRADGLFAYQLAVVVDDADTGVNQVVRGADLLLSTPRQVFLQSCLGYPIPHYVHLPLALGDDGQKISKRHGVIETVAPVQDARLLWRALSFLGQEPPVGGSEGAPEEILSWAVAHFNLSRVPRTDRQVPDRLLKNAK